jgi:hypothetical protein
MHDLQLKMITLQTRYVGDAVCYKQEGRGSYADEVIGYFNLPNPSSCTTVLQSTQPLIETNIRNIVGLKTA